MITIHDSFFRLLLAVILGGLIGWERETHDRPAGFRTHILVSVGSALVMLVSINMYYSFPLTKADPGRIAAQVVSGMGFLGAGTIIREGLSVKGLTTAASLWSVAAIGLAIGGGYFDIALITTFMVFITLFFLSQLEFSKETKSRKVLICKMFDTPGILGKVGLILGSVDVNINNIRIDKETEKGEILIEFEVEVPDKSKIEKINSKLIGIEGLVEIYWRN